MIQLALLRHAKSSWADPGLDDFDRPLNARGRTTAPLMGQLLASLKFVPDLVLCSPSKRTRETLESILPQVSLGSAEIKFCESLYLATADDLLDHLRTQSGAAKQLLIIGHNPGLHMLAAKLAASGDPAQLIRLSEKFPTAALALFSFPAVFFAALDIKNGHLDAFITPKDRA